MSCDAKWAVPDSRWPEHRFQDLRRARAVPNGSIPAWALLESCTSVSAFNSVADRNHGNLGAPGSNGTTNLGHATFRTGIEADSCWSDTNTQRSQGDSCWEQELVQRFPCPRNNLPSHR